MIRDKLMGMDCILAFETAADYLGICAPSVHRWAYFVYSREELNIEGVVCKVVDSYENLEIVEDRGMRCTSERQTIIDLLIYQRDDGIICESISHYHCTHGDSFEGLNIPSDVQPIFYAYVDDALSFYAY